MVQLRWCDVYVADFETTVNESFTDVWAAGLADLRSESFVPLIANSIESWYQLLLDNTQDKKTIVYFHNEKFDGSFILSYLLSNGYTVAYTEEGWMKDSTMPEKSVRTVISMENQWYEICIHETGKKYIYIRDSLKLLPYPLYKIGYELGYEKLTIDYTKDRVAGAAISEEEKQYLIRDIEILYYALRKFVIEEEHTGVTIGSCCKTDYMKTHNRGDLSYYFPNIAKKGYDKYFRDSYFGGICYVNPKFQGKLLQQGVTYDVNSLYPYVMNSDRKYPVSYPHFFKGKVPFHVFDDEKVYFIHFKCRFWLKDGRIPFIQLDDAKYRGKGYLETSDYEFNGDYYSSIEEEDGSVKKIYAEMTLTEVDWKLFYDTYNIEDLEIIGGAWFWAKTGKELFGNYVDKYKDKKQNSKGIERTSSKLFLNNLAGKLSAKPESTTRIPYLNDDGVLCFKNIIKEDVNRAWYIPAASFITAYGRDVLLTVIKENYKTFVYCDTDSVHLLGTRSCHNYIPISDTEFGCWKIERFWNYAIFVKQKTYIEQAVLDGFTHYVVKCAGMCRRSKELLEAKLDGYIIDTDTKEEQDFVNSDISILDFKSGFEMPGGLVSKRVKGGTVLVSSKYKLT